MSDGVMLPLGEICRNASRRFAPPEDGKVWFINTGDVESGRFTHNDLSDWEGLPGQAKKAVVEGDILYSEIRPGNGRYAFVDKQYPNAVVSTKFMVIEAGESILPKYLYHVITSPELQNAMKLIAESRSGTFPQITYDSIAHLELMVPSKAEQLAVSSLLDAIEGRIRNNQKMNHTLEDIAKAIFKSWFVDFDPVRAKAEGRPTGLPPEISDLFPDELVDSEIGEIPCGWDATIVSECGKVVCGKTPSTKDPENFDGQFPFITIPDMRGNLLSLSTDRSVSEKGAASLKGKMLPAGSICVSCIATPGLVSVTTSDSFTNQQINSIVPRNEVDREYLLFSMMTFGDLISSAGSGGSVFANLSTGRFKELPILQPCEESRTAFSAIIRPMLQRIEISQKEISTLSELRDTLLPKLISGELRIPDAEKFLEEAGI